MAYKSSSALLVAIFLMAGPALAQEAAPTTPAETADSTTETGGAASETTAGETTEGTATEAPAEPAAPAAATPEAATTDAPATAAPAADAPAATETAPAATAPADAAPADAAPAEAAPAGTAPAEAPAADAEPQVGAYYLKATHGDWTIRCIKAEEGQPDPCELYQLLKDGEGNSVAEVTMIPLVQGEAAAGATIVAPLETDLVRGLGLKIDTAAPRGYPFNFCAPVGCVARMGFDTAGLNGLKRGNAATVSLLPFAGDPENPVELPMSLSGFTAAFTELEGIAAEAQAQLAAQPEAEAPAADAPAAEAPAAEAPAADAPAADAPAAEAPAEGETAPAN